MVGSNLAIVKLAAMSLLDTLQENDFVNVVVVSSKPSSVQCIKKILKDQTQDATLCAILHAIVLGRVET